jgi:UTP--glucose-1-phosphate uridylyltransferase
MKVTTAVIMASGFGTRMLPATAAVQKELLPILNRPVIDYVVSDCVAAGIHRIVFVVQAGSHSLQDLYVGRPELDAHLQRYGKTAELNHLRHMRQQAVFEFVEQPLDAGYGTAMPVRTVRPHLPAGEAVLVCNGDDLMYHANGQSEAAHLIATFLAGHAVGALSGLAMPNEALSRYGVLQTRQTDSRELLTGIVEKPAAGAAPTNLVNLGKYVMTPTMLEFVDNLAADQASGEYLLTDAVVAAAKQHAVAVHRSRGRHLDTGNLASWLEANQVMAQSQIRSS